MNAIILLKDYLIYRIIYSVSQFCNQFRCFIFQR